MLASYKQLCLLASRCHKTFIDRADCDLENNIDEMLKQMDIVLNSHPSMTGLILNTNNKGLHFVALYILKQACFCRLLCTKSNIATEQINSLIKASLFLLYVVFPTLIAAKKDNTKLATFIKSLTTCPKDSFNLARNLPLADNITLKLLSQTCGANTYSKANSSLQVLVLASLNCAVTAFSGFKGKVTFNTALSRLLASQDGLQVKQLNLHAYKLELSKLCTPLTDYNGALVRLKNKNLAFIINLNSEQKKCKGFEFNQTSINDYADLTDIEFDHVRLLLPHQTLDHEKLISLLFNLELLKDNDKTLPSVSKAKKLEANNGIHRYSANSSWRKISKSVLTDNNNALCKVLTKYPEQSKLLLKYASNHNRQQQPVTDIKHAIVMLGNVQLFPTLCNDNIKVKQVYVKQMGSDVVNYKIDLFSHILFELHRHSNIGLPKFHELIGRILMIALMTIPKVSFVASTPACLTKPNGHKTVSLAGVFGLNTIENWKKISLILSKSWLLPKAYYQIIEQYFDLLNMNPKTNTGNKSLNENTLLIIIATYFFQHFIHGENQLITNQTIEGLLTKFNSIKPNLNELHKQVSQTVTIYTPLS